MEVLTAYVAKTNFDYLYIPWSFLSYLIYKHFSVKSKKKRCPLAVQRIGGITLA